MAEIELPIHEHHAEGQDRAFSRRVALTTAIYAVVLAVTALGGNKTMKEMLLAQQQASDQWAFYQAKVLREHHYRVETLRAEAELAERGATMSPEARAKYDNLRTKFAGEERRYNAEKEEIKKKAEEYEHERDHSRARNPNFEFAEVLLQIAVVTASVSILATSRQLYLISIVFAVLGALLCLNGYLLLIHLPF